MRGSCKTYSPPILTTLCSSFERSQGFGASSLFKQRALRWNCSLMRNAPLVTWNLLTYRTGGWVEGLMFRISYIPFYTLLMDFLMVTGLAAALMINPFFLFFSYFRGLVGTISHNYILWHAAEQASLLTVLCVPLLDIIQQIFAVIGTVKCLVFDIWVYPWRVGCWKSFEHLTPADFKTWSNSGPKPEAFSQPFPHLENNFGWGSCTGKETLPCELDRLGCFGVGCTWRIWRIGICSKSDPGTCVNQETPRYMQYLSSAIYICKILLVQSQRTERLLHFHTREARNGGLMVNGCERMTYDPWGFDRRSAFAGQRGFSEILIHTHT